MANQKQDIKQNIKESIQQFDPSTTQGSLSSSALHLFQTLGYNTDRQQPLSSPTYKEFQSSYITNNDKKDKFSEERAQTKDWQYIDLLFQLSSEEVTPLLPGFTTQKVDDTIIESYLFFVVELSKDAYSRSTLSQITREVNKLFPMPVMILFKYGTNLSMAIIDRRLHKRDEQKDVLIKVTLIKDIDIQSPHRAHIDILFELSLDELCRKYKFQNFVELHQAWQKALDTKELNKKFYKELSNWYFWAMEEAVFPDDIEKNKEIRNATSLIRLITRIIFIWFIKEKGLIPEKLFDPRELKSILATFAPTAKTSSFYQAILQNLFFGTLNQKMNERKFAINGCQAENKAEYGVKTLFRYDDQFTISKEQVLQMFRDIPFLNGGLFDCLDKENDVGKVLYADGFSRNPAKRAQVPDFLFFSGDKSVDLNETYDTKNKEYTTKGLINILDSYKFTITENTPIEEEIALDPELLGEVFQNLLASYNPETKTTARKNTGSFYTPREIVGYMVDESLIAYFKQKLEDRGFKNTEEKLRDLISYNGQSNPFTKEETIALISAIDSCKILDPACGSGAFPMGILQKLVHILHKLDPQNEQWKERQLQKARGIDDSAIREQLIADIESAFVNNELDYGRKLYLIENCIYGVDIQPIAIQIAKLRFFISLIIDQKKDRGKDNLGIRALPNLETKFVCANTLIGLEKPDGFLRDPMLVKKEEELKELRHDYFSSKTREQKLGYQKKDQKLRKEISELLVKDGWGDKSAKQLSEWNPYDQNASSPFFDPEWMYGLMEGFDIVIGNPPYIRVQGIDRVESEDFKKIFKSATGKYDIYVLFVEKSINFINDKGIVSLIIPHKWINSSFGSGLREICKDKISKFISFGELQVFTASTYSSLVWFRPNNKKIRYLKLYNPDLSESLANINEKDFTILENKDLGKDVWVLSDAEVNNVLKILNKQSNKVRDLFEGVYQGIVSGDNKSFYLNDCHITGNLITGYSEVLNTRITLEKNITKPLLKGESVKRFEIDFDNTYIIYPYELINSDTCLIQEIALKENYPLCYSYLSDIKNRLVDRGSSTMNYPYWYSLWNFRKIENQKRVKILTSDVCFTSSMCTDSKGEYFYNDTCYGLIKKQNDSFSYNYYLALLNSSICWFFLKNTGSVLRGGYYRFKTNYIETFPMPTINEIKQPMVKQIENLVEKISDLKKQKSDTTALESEIDLLVYQLYDLTPAEIKIVEGQDK